MEWIKSLTLATKATVIGIAALGLLAVGFRAVSGLGRADGVVVTPTAPSRRQEPAAQPTQPPDPAGMETATFALG